jgi:uncharacterized protein (DUF58 family)
MIGQQFLASRSAAAGETGLDAMAALARVPAWSLTEFHWEHRPERRGRFPQSGTLLATGFPFGVWQSSRWIEFDQTCLVWPAVPALGDPLAVRQLRALGERSYENRVGHEGDFLGLRAYRPGDSLRKIHWPQSVRAGDLIVRESELAVSKQVTVLIDVSDLMSGSAGRGVGAGDEPPAWAAAERRLRVALAVTESLWGGGFDVRLQLGYQVWETSGERRRVQALMDQVAEWSWADFFSRWTAVRTINLRPDFVVADWQTWHQGAEAVRLSEPAQGMILVHPEVDLSRATLVLTDCCSPKAGVACWQAGQRAMGPVADRVGGVAGSRTGSSQGAGQRSAGRAGAGAPGSRFS